MSLFVTFCLAVLLLVNADNIKPNRRRLTPYITDTRYRWTGGKVPYVISNSISSTMRGRIYEALRRFNSKVIVKFIPRTNELNYVTFVGGTGCSSYIGMLGGSQPITLGDWCNTGSVVHEMMHAVGFHHAHNRKDRNNYVRVSTNNFNYVIPAGYTDCEGYDYGSIMHYPESGNLKATRNHKNVRLGQTEAMSAQDIRCINKIYSGIATPSAPTTPTFYPAPRPTYRMNPTYRPRPRPRPYPTYRRYYPTYRRYYPTYRRYYPTYRRYPTYNTYYKPYKPWPNNNGRRFYSHNKNKPTCFNQPSFHAWLSKELKNRPANPPGMTEWQCVSYCKKRRDEVCGVTTGVGNAVAFQGVSNSVHKEEADKKSRERVLITLLILALVVILAQSLACCVCNKNKMVG